MKILAIEKEIEGTNWGNSNRLLKEEAYHVFELYLSDVLREIYFTENKQAVLVLEANDKATVEQLLNDFPLVKSNKIRFEILALRPYTGYERVIKMVKHKSKNT